MATQLYPDPPGATQVGAGENLLRVLAGPSALELRAVPAAWLLVQDPEIDQNLRPVVLDCVHRLVAQLLPRPVAVVLTGSFARGEGSVARVDGRLKVLGDMEFMVFFHADACLDYVQDALVNQAKRLEEHMADCGIDCAMEFSPVTIEYAQSLRPHIFGYELLRHGHRLWGRDPFIDVLRFPATAIPKWDAWRMLNNRVIEQLQWLDMLQDGDRDLLQSAFYQVVKCYLDIATSLLIFKGDYRDRYAERAEALAAWSNEVKGCDDMSFLPLVVERVTSCTQFKLWPDLTRTPLGVCLAQSDAEKLRHDVRGAMLALVPVIREVWRWETAQLSGCQLDTATNDRSLREAVLKTQSRWEKLRGWAKIALMPAVGRQYGFLRRMTTLLQRGSPRYLVYCIASALYFFLPQILDGNQFEAGQLENLLPVSFGQHAGNPRPWWRLRDNVLTAWHSFLRNDWA